MTALDYIKTIFFLFLASIGLFSAGATQAETVDLDEVVAIAEHEAILRSDLDKRMAQVRSQAAARNAPIPPDKILTEQILNALILESLQLQMADRLGIRVDDDSLNTQMIKIAAQNNMSLTQFSQVLEKEGVTYPFVREQVRREMTISQLRQRQVGQRIRISDSEIDRAMSNKTKQSATEYHLANILIMPSENTPEAMEQAQKTINDVYNEAKSGRSFAQLAAAHSDAPNAKSGGDLGWRTLSQLPPAVKQAIAALNDSDLTPPIQDQQGVYIIKVIEKRDTSNKNETASATQIHAKQIFISPSKIRTDEEAKKLIYEIKAQLDQGADFAKLAKKYSDDPSSASSGGDLGWNAPSKFSSEISSRLETMPEKTLSEPFRTKFGWHIVEVIEKKQDSAAEQEKDAARSSIRQQKYEDELQLWLRQIRQEAFVEIKLK